MHIYEINKALDALIDGETGEIRDYDAFAELAVERDEKIESTALWIKNLTALAKDIREEEKTLAERRKAVEARAGKLKDYIGRVLDGQKFTTAKVAISFRTSHAVEVDDDFSEWAKMCAPQYLCYKEPDVDKTAIKDAIANGTHFAFARIIDNAGVQIK